MLQRMLTVLLATFCTLTLATEPREVEVVLNNYTIKPNKLILKAGEPVILKVKNAATFIPHNLVIKATEAGIELKVVVGAGKVDEIRFTPTRPGSYEMYCDTRPPIGKSHREKGMHGVLLVE
jgi:uncharacterized cupredoxin-like copper-binding protein